MTDFFLSLNFSSSESYVMTYIVCPCSGVRHCRCCHRRRRCCDVKMFKRLLKHLLQILYGAFLGRERKIYLAGPGHIARMSADFANLLAKEWALNG